MRYNLEVLGLVALKKNGIVTRFQKTHIKNTSKKVGAK